jgi:hypothetical protein
MRQSIGGAWLFSISITLMMFIIAYVAITIDYSNAYQLKNDVILVLEEYNGLNNNSDDKIISRLKKKKFLNKINCSKGYDSATYYSGKHDGSPSKYFYAVTNIQGSGEIKSSKNGGNYGYICIYKYTAIKKDSKSDASLTKAFYSVTTAFGFDFPI